MYHTEFDLNKAVCGIDIGTCNSTAVLFDGDALRIIHHHQQDSLPSIVAMKADGDFLVGKPAKDYSQSPENCCYETKRFFGMTYDEYLSNGYQYPFKIIRDENNMAAIELEPIEGHQHIIRPQDVSKLIIDEFLESSKKEYEIEPQIVVLTCPVVYDENKKQLLKSTNSKIYDVIPEPQAAAISYLSTNMIYEDTNLLLFDFGAGTLDISIVCGNYNDIKNLKILKNVGTALGGADIDKCFAQYLIENYLADQTEIDMSLIIKKCSKAKKRLSMNNSTIIRGVGKSISISQEEYIGLMKKENGIYEKCTKLIDKALNELHRSADFISHIGFIGGSTQSVGLMEEVIRKFPNLRQPPSIHDRVTAVATGAAIYAARYKHHPTQPIINNPKPIKDPKKISHESLLENTFVKPHPKKKASFTDPNPGQFSQKMDEGCSCCLIL